MTCVDFKGIHFMFPKEPYESGWHLDFEVHYTDEKATRFLRLFDSRTRPRRGPLRLKPEDLYKPKHPNEPNRLINVTAVLLQLRHGSNLIGPPCVARHSPGFLLECVQGASWHDGIRRAYLHRICQASKRGVQPSAIGELPNEDDEPYSIAEVSFTRFVYRIEEKSENEGQCPVVRGTITGLSGTTVDPPPVHFTCNHSKTELVQEDFEDWSDIKKISIETAGNCPPLPNPVVDEDQWLVGLEVTAVNKGFDANGCAVWENVITRRVTSPPV